MKHLIYFLVLLFLPLGACEKDDLVPSIGYEEVTLKDLAGFDGCGFVLLKKDAKYLEPINLDEFVSSPVDGNNYKVKYRVETGYASICMVGEMISIVEMKPR